MTWSQLLSILAKQFETATPEENFGTCLNEYLNQAGLEDARQELPRAHAVACAQINHKALFRIKSKCSHRAGLFQLRLNNPIAYGKSQLKLKSYYLAINGAIGAFD